MHRITERLSNVRSTTKILVCWLVCSCGALSASDQPHAEAWFPTGEPELLEWEPSLIPLLSEEEYRTLAEAMQGNPAFIALRDTPPALSQNVRFGSNLSYSGKNRSFALAGNDKRGYVLYADLNGSGTLTDDKPLRLEKSGDGFFVVLPIIVEENVGGRNQTYRFQMKLILGEAVPPGQDHVIPVMKKFDTFMRRGIAWIGEQEIAFALLGRRGTYDEKTDEVLFDLDGSGLDLRDERSQERFLVSDAQLSINGTAYAFRVDRFGRGISLRSLGTSLPARPSLEIGSVVPDISLVDLDGKTHELADYRGQVLLLNFWASWCAHCREEAPRLARIHQRLSDRGFAILGINPNDSEVEIAGFMEEFGIKWSQVKEPVDGPAHELFRVRAWPTHYLIGKDGRILATHIDWSSLEDSLEIALRK